jgi:hypothetical protein
VACYQGIMKLRHSAADHRQDFLRLAEAVYREFSAPLLPMHVDSDRLIALALNLGGTYVEIIHSLDIDPSSVLIDCEISPVPKGASNEFEFLLLRASGELFRTCQASLGVDEDRQSFFCSQWKPLAPLTAADFLLEAKALVEPLKCWIHAGLHEDHLQEAVHARALVSLNLSADSALWREAFLATVEAIGASRAPVEGHGGDTASMINVEITCNGARFSAVHSVAMPRRLILELRLSEAATDCGAMARLLRFNREISRNECAAFSIAQHGASVAFACALDLEGLDATALRDRMIEIAAFAGQPN